MKRQLFIRIFGLLALYVGVFVMLAFVQFDDQSRFRKNIGALRISGNVNRQKSGLTQVQTPDGQVYVIKDGMEIFFAGMEFDLSGETGGGLMYVDSEGVRTAAYPESMTISMNEARFHLSGKQEISFYTNRENEGKELVISALLAEDVERIFIPFKPVYKADLRRDDMNFLTVAYNGTEYTFEANDIDEQNSLIVLSRSDPVVFYRAVSSDNDFNFASFIVSGGMEKGLYNDITHKWLDTAFSVWERRISAADADEDVVTAYLAEAAQRDALAQAVNMVPASGGTMALTFLSAPFFGRLNSQLREFIVSERTKTSAISSYTNTELSNYLTEEKIFDFLAQRGHRELFDRGIEYINTLNPADIRLDMCAGIFEGWMSWNKSRGDSDNPFEALLPRVFTLISAHTKKDKRNTSVFVAEETVDVLYNIRLGTVLAAYGEAVMNNGWAAVGRSLVISVLSFADSDGSIASEIGLSDDGNFAQIASADTLSAEQVYHRLGLSEFYPHAAGLETANNRIWTWTVSSDVDAHLQNNVLDIYISFPLGETHYLYITNVPSFSRIQMRNMDYRSDPQFEQYNAPGWLYSAAETVLMVKMVQQAQVEHIRLIF